MTRSEPRPARADSAARGRAAATVSTDGTSARRRVVAVIAAFLVAAAAVIAPATAFVPTTPASAHNYPVSTTPKEKSTVTEQPGIVSMTTNDALLPSGLTALRVVDADGRYYETDCPAIDDDTVSAPAELGDAGPYTVQWQVVSADGHPISGEFGFDWQPAAGEPAAVGTDSPACDTDEANTDEADAGAAATDESASAPQAQTSALTADLLWIGGALLAVLAAAVVTWLAVRRRPGTEEASSSGDGSTPNAPTSPKSE